MEEGSHGHAHRPHATGFRWLDLSLALSAFVVSLVSIWLAIHNGRTMERLVAANSYPNIDFAYGNTFDFHDGRSVRPGVYLSLENTGIGPARLRAVELSFAGRPAANLHALLALCCTQEDAASLPKTNYWFSGDVRGVMVKAGSDVNLFAWPQTAEDPRWPRLEQQVVRGRIGIRVCYCSVFDECYVHASEQREPERVKACPVPAVPYGGE
ncbi:MAG: hypothetical protein ACLPQ6_11680 [Steroidobacteraceae bacterium]